jgi:DNA replication and repair protein RecF
LKPKVSVHPVPETESHQLRLNRLTLTDFRNYSALRWQPRARVTVLHGPNGSGKTNLLEAISLLVPGRGLRSARPGDLPRGDGAGTWSVAGHFQTTSGEAIIGTGTTGTGPTSTGTNGTGTTTGNATAGPLLANQNPTDRRVFRLNGVAPRSQADIIQHIAVVWLTPQMDRLFQEGPSGRRRFLDRLVWALEPAHARQISAHDTAVSSRNRLLAQRSHHQGRNDDAWLAGIEDSIARHAVAATASRLGLIAQLNDQAATPVPDVFPKGAFALACPIADRMQSASALAVEEWLRAELAAARGHDAATGSTSLGAHRTDISLSDRATGTPAHLASTGQQKALLMGTILSHAQLIATARGFAPLLLLDEPAVHLDERTRNALWQSLDALPAQIVMTGTDGDLFLPLAGQADGYITGGGILMPDQRFIGGKTNTNTVTATD